MINKLTAKQKRVYDFIQKYQTEHRSTPTLKIIAQEFKKSIPTVHQYLSSMKRNNIDPFLNVSVNPKRNYSIGIIGFGIVGQAVAYGFSNYEIHTYDKYQKTETLPSVVKSSEFIFICLPTPIKSDESGIDLSIIEDNVQEIVKYTDNTDKIIVIKSTVVPGTTAGLAAKYPKSHFCFNPEFLREASFLQDFVNTDRIVIGADSDVIFRRVSALYQSIMPSTPIFSTDPTSAEMVKYMANCLLSTKVIFANEMYDICQNLGIKYEEVKKMVVADKRIEDTHLDVTTNRGFGGKCFPKDLLALRALAKSRKVDTLILDSVWKKNLALRKVHDWEEIPFAVTTVKK
jgi:UDP-glucose 6-dehydrogenase